MNLRLEERLNQVIDRPPVRWYLADAGGRVEEEQTLVGTVDAPADRRRELEDYGIYMELAEFDVENQRWEGCLFSEQVADMLEELHAEGQFPYVFEAAPSVAELDWLVRRAAGEEARAPHTLRAYRSPASAEDLARIAAGDLRLQHG